MHIHTHTHTTGCTHTHHTLNENVVFIFISSTGKQQMGAITPTREYAATENLLAHNEADATLTNVSGSLTQTHYVP